MDLRSLKLYMASKLGVRRVDALFLEIQMIIIRSLQAVQQVRALHLPPHVTGLHVTRLPFPFAAPSSHRHRFLSSLFRVSHTQSLCPV